MKIAAAAQMASLKEVTAQPKVRKMTAIQVARRVFQLAAAAGAPFKNLKPEDWAKKWLDSSEFVLTEIVASKAALPVEPRNSELVQERMHASSESIEPIVVDTNKNKVGSTPGGYCPPIIVVDGKHRHRSQTMQGHSHLEAWVGVKALKRLVNTAIIRKLDIKTAIPISVSRLESAAQLNNVPRQDVAVGNSAPHKAMPGVKAREVGMKKDGPVAKIKVYSSDASDVTPHHDPSDRLDKEHGQSLDPTDISQPLVKSPSSQAPGAGVGPRLKPNKGASNSEFQSKKFRSDGSKGKTVK